MAKASDLQVQGFVVAFLRKLSGKKQEDFGKAARVDQSDLSKFEAGKREAPEESMRRMAEAAGVDESRLALVRRVFAALLSAIERKQPIADVQEPSLEVLRPVLLAVLPYLIEEAASKTQD